MKRIIILFTIVLCSFFNTILAQNHRACHLCNMNVLDEHHKAIAINNENESIYFGSIECMINFLQQENIDDYSELTVGDYNTTQMIKAQSAYYLISTAIPSPMGVNLSAFATRNMAKEKSSLPADMILNWSELLEAFKDPKFGVTGHEHHNHYRPDSHGPIGLMGDHLHERNGLMISFRYMNMGMNGNRSGTDNISDENVFANYMVVPQKMNMEMYMLGIMYAPSDNLTLMAMQNIIINQMDLKARMMMNGMTMFRDFSTESSGLGDLEIGALYGLLSNIDSSLHLNASLIIPIGSIKKRGDTPMMQGIKLPYTMQLGSGTLDFKIGGTYKKSYTNLSWGSQFLATLRTGTNSESYRLGNVYDLNLWGACKISDNISLSARVQCTVEDQISGADLDLNPMMVHTANSMNYGGNTIRSFIGSNFSFAEGSGLKKFRLGVEAGLPIHKDYNGVQMNEDYLVNLGVKYDLL